MPKTRKQYIVKMGKRLMRPFLSRKKKSMSRSSSRSPLELLRNHSLNRRGSAVERGYRRRSTATVYRHTSTRGSNVRRGTNNLPMGSTYRHTSTRGSNVRRGTNKLPMGSNYRFHIPLGRQI